MTIKDHKDLHPDVQPLIKEECSRNLVHWKQAVKITNELDTLSSVRYILEELNSKEGIEKLSELTGLPTGVIANAFENLFGKNKNMKFKASEISEYVTGYLLADTHWHSIEDIKSVLHNSLAMLEDEQDGIKSMVLRRAEHVLTEEEKTKS